MLSLQGYETDGNTPPNPASGGNGISSSGWLFTVCLNDYCPVLNSYAPAVGGNGISTWFQQLWKVVPLPLSHWNLFSSSYMQLRIPSGQQWVAGPLE